MIHRKTLRKCGGYLEHFLRRRTTEQYAAEYIINILEELTTRTRIGSSRVNLKKGFDTPWKDSVDKRPKENSNNKKYTYAVVIRKLNISNRAPNLPNTCPKRGNINEIAIAKEPSCQGDSMT
ncbi:hypothetical protein O181_030375 [Austropuccinia psidii MF-1]|uniref:Uncharacterized protein n=1 Tax=Austropuccinia psidii MF-1 TaxID=1389203 RepID=A0A9Q3H663_9BASI|nr:hypothetical protein [Austropuccinia psidii MF-1]